MSDALDTTAVDYVPFETTVAAPAEPAAGAAGLERLSHVPVELAVASVRPRPTYGEGLDRKIVG